MIKQKGNLEKTETKVPKTYIQTHFFDNSFLILVAIDFLLYSFK